jgi:hypothetical protein
MTSPDDPSDRSSLVGLGQKLITVLPPAFVMLVLVNVAFLGVVMWFMDSQIDQRTKLVTTFVDRCWGVVDKAEEIPALHARFDALEHDVRALETQTHQQQQQRGSEPR